jgi:hypothetical protein
MPCAGLFATTSEPPRPTQGEGRRGNAMPPLGLFRATAKKCHFARPDRYSCSSPFPPVDHAQRLPCLSQAMAAVAASTIPTGVVGSGAAWPAATVPSPMSSEPTVREMLESTLVAATLEVMPLVPVQEPLPRTVTSAVTRSVVVSPLATVNLPLPTSTRPPALGARPPTVVFG